MPILDDLRHRLRRLGVTTGREFQSQPAALRQRADIDTLVDGQALTTADGACYAITHSYEGDTSHGTHNLSEWLALRPETVAHVGQNGTLADTDPQRFIFLDTETTGLGGGAFAFLVGIGYFESGSFVVRQFFLRDPAEEVTMLGLLSDILAADTSLVTFNGRTFDVPLLAGRYILARKQSLIGSLPNLDLLHPSRRLWRRRLASCALGALEGDVLGVRRTHADVPGSLIPYLYRQYLQTRDAHDMVRVLYHNEIDLMSMVTLAVRLCQAYDRPEANERPIDDQLSLARWYYDQGQVAESEAAYRAAAAQAPDAEFALRRAGRAGLPAQAGGPARRGAGAVGRPGGPEV